jgi:hypothetical protein
VLNGLPFSNVRQCLTEGCECVGAYLIMSVAAVPDVHAVPDNRMVLLMVLEHQLR